MRVICIETKYWYPTKYISVEKGKVYHVTKAETFSQPWTNIKHPGVTFMEGTWYELLEIEGIHHSEAFLEIPDDSEEIEKFKINEPEQTINI